MKLIYFDQTRVCLWIKWLWAMLTLIFHFFSWHHFKIGKQITCNKNRNKEAQSKNDYGEKTYTHIYTEWKQTITFDFICLIFFCGPNDEWINVINCLCVEKTAFFFWLIIIPFLFISLINQEIVKMNETTKFIKCEWILNFFFRFDM